MPELLLVHSTIIPLEDAVKRARRLAIPVVISGLASWMLEQGFTYGVDGYLALAVCALPIHNAQHEVLGSWTNGAISKANLTSVQDHPVPPPSESELDMAAIKWLGTRDNPTSQEQERLLQLLAKYADVR